MADTPTPSTTDLVQSFLNGGSNDTSEAGSASSSPADAGDDQIARAEESSPEELFPGSESTPEASEKAAPASKAASPTSRREAITISDDKGRRRVEVDFNDRKQMEKYVQMAYGARKWQAERDTARREKSEIDQRLGELQTNWNALEQAFQRQGIAGVVDLLEGKPGAHEAYVKRAIDRHEFLKQASPEEREALAARERAEQASREVSRMRKENEDFKKEIQSQREEADLRSLESRVNPVFDRYRFADKLGDANDEHMFDEMLWNSALKRLEPYEEQGLPITPELIEREFRAVASAIRKRVGQQAERKAARAVEQRKAESTTNVQTAVRNGYRQPGGIAQEARDLVNSGNLTGLLKGWNKYGGLFGGGTGRKR